MPPKFRINYSQSSEIVYDKFFTEETKGFRTKNSSYFKTIISFINNIVECANFKLTKSGIKITSLDKAHVALIDCFIPCDFFKNYNFNDDNKEIVIGLNVGILIKILNHLKQNDELIFNYKGDTLDISFINPKYQKHYNIKLMDIDSDELSIFDCNTTTNITIESKYFNDIVRELCDIGDVVKFKVFKECINDEDQNIELQCFGDMTSLGMILSNDDLTLQNLQNISLEFSLTNLETFSKGYNLNKYMNIEIDNNYPIKLSYKIMDTGYINYFLAPRIED
jgi:proliferating cell nuclear antigen PCNA